MMALSSMTPSSVKNIASSDAHARISRWHKTFIVEYLLSLSGRKKKLINRNIATTTLADTLF